ncbi:hypothetical protein BT69DRAFT_79436 [Atractiella rhizophila]|nr:hypothetical protein BT69DRAFT_79436 [Atractiella rhizophila]
MKMTSGRMKRMSFGMGWIAGSEWQRGWEYDDEDPPISQADIQGPIDGMWDDVLKRIRDRYHEDLKGIFQVLDDGYGSLNETLLEKITNAQQSRDQNVTQLKKLVSQIVAKVRTDMETQSILRSKISDIEISKKSLVTEYYADMDKAQLEFRNTIEAMTREYEAAKGSLLARVEECKKDEGKKRFNQNLKTLLLGAENE